MDRFAFYRFYCDDAQDCQAQSLVALFRQNVPIVENSIIDYLFENVSYLLQMAPEATLRQILRKKYCSLNHYVLVISQSYFCYRPDDRTDDDIELVYEEIMNIKAFSHLSNQVKKELSQVIAFEKHKEKCTTSTQK